MLYYAQEKGQGLVEYAIIIILIAVLLVGSLALITRSLSTMFSQIASAIPS